MTTPSTPAKTFRELEQDMRNAMDAMEQALNAEWAAFTDHLVADANLSGDYETDKDAIDVLELKLKLRAAQEMNRNKATWTGATAYMNNAVEGLRHSVAEGVFQSGGASLLFRAVRG